MTLEERVATLEAAMASLGGQLFVDPDPAVPLDLVKYLGDYEEAELSIASQFEAFWEKRGPAPTTPAELRAKIDQSVQGFLGHAAPVNEFALNREINKVMDAFTKAYDAKAAQATKE